jgi:hypothetical protein
METIIERAPQISSKTISTEKFRDYARLNTDPKEYVFGDEVTRENFCSMFIQSFARSRGSRVAQFAFFSWHEKHGGLDVVSLFKNFSNAGAFGCLSDKERQMFLDSYSQVSTHKKPGIFNIKIRQGINEFTKDMISAETRLRFREDLARTGFANIDTLPANEFRRELTAYVKQNSQYRTRPNEQTVS